MKDYFEQFDIRLSELQNWIESEKAKMESIKKTSTLRRAKYETNYDRSKKQA